MRTKRPYFETSVLYYFTPSCPYCGLRWEEKSYDHFGLFGDKIYEYTENPDKFTCLDCEEENKRSK